jgi:SWI/SNF-related matrix-associated actin-dependent regulator of chromatin subfamily A protein 2/4
MQALMSMQQKQNRIAPVTKPVGLDPIELLNERENRYFSSLLLLILTFKIISFK